MPLLALIPIFLLACIAGVFAVRSVAPAQPMPLLAVTSAISSIIIVGALVLAAESSHAVAKYLGLGGIMLATVTIVGGFAATERMLAGAKRQDRP